MSVCRKCVEGGKWDTHVVAQEKQRKWREALNIPNDTSGSQDRNRKQQYVSNFLFIFSVLIGQSKNAILILWL